MPIRKFSAATLKNKAARTHKKPWLRCARSIPWLEKIAVQLEKFAAFPERDFIEVVRGYVYSAKYPSKPGTDIYPDPIMHLDEILSGLYAFHAEKDNARIPLFCQACTLAMGVILDGFGIFSRETAIMSTYGREGEDTFLSHAVLEVWNSELERWELQDPTLNLAYGLETETGIRPASAWELFAKDPSVIRCIAAQRNYFDFSEDLSLLHLQKGKKFIANGMFNVVVTNYLSYNPVAIINLDSVNLEKGCQCYGNLNLMEIIANFYCYGGHPPVIQGSHNGKWITLPPLKNFDAPTWLTKHNISFKR